MAIEITDNNIDDTLSRNDLVIISFSAIWCQPCKVLAPIIEQVYELFKGTVLVGKVDVDSNSETTTKYGIRNIPNIIFIKGGEVIGQHVGATTKSELIKKIDATFELTKEEKL